MSDFSIIIVTWNALHHLETFLPTVWEHSHHDAEIIIADNASTDGTAEWVGKKYPSIRVVTLDKNYGYCGGNNRAARYARNRFLVFLNNDVEVTPGWLNPIAELLDLQSDIGAVQPKLRSWNNRNYFEYAGAAGGYLDRFAYPFCRGRIFDTLEKDFGQYDDNCDISWASGASMAIRKDLFFETGGFDESFEFHMEEIDLCWQLWNRGYRVRYCPESVVYHLGGGSLSPDSPRKVYYNYRNNLKMIWKNSTTRHLFLRLPARLLLDYIALVYTLSQFRFAEAGAILRAHVHFFRSLPSLVSRRKALHIAGSGVNTSSVLMPLSLIWQYFIRRRTTFDQLPKKMPV
ncbi:MAG: glycosyltransferase family 2 protein [Balneolales bacterium]